MHSDLCICLDSPLFFLLSGGEASLKISLQACGVFDSRVPREVAPGLLRVLSGVPLLQGLRRAFVRLVDVGILQLCNFSLQHVGYTGVASDSLGSYVPCKFPLHDA